MKVKLNKSIILESTGSLIQEFDDGSPRMSTGKKIGLVALGLGAIGMAHAGAFGDDVQHLTDTAGEALGSGAHNVMNHASNAAHTTSNFYGQGNSTGADSTHTSDKGGLMHKMFGSDDSKPAEEDNSDSSAFSKIGKGVVGVGSLYGAVKAAQAYNGSGLQKSVNNGTAGIVKKVRQTPGALKGAYTGFKNGY